MDIHVLHPNPEAERLRETPKHIKEFIRHLNTRILANELRLCAPTQKLDQIIEARIKGKVFLLQRLVKCGKLCKSCPHGPYWYGYYRAKGRFISFYIGRKLPQRFHNSERIHLPTRKETATNGHDNQTKE